MTVREEMAARMVQAVYSLDTGRYGRFTVRATEALREAGHFTNTPQQREAKRKLASKDYGYDFWYTALSQLPDEKFLELYDSWMWANCAQR